MTALPTTLRVLRIYHSGVVDTWRARERWMRTAGARITLVSATIWNEGGALVPCRPGGDDFVVGVRTFGTHPALFLYDPINLWRALRADRHDVIDIHEEPYSLAAAEVQILAWMARSRAVICLYSAQNIEKRYPPPFRQLERIALRRSAAVHTCNDEAARIVRRKGFRGITHNLGLGVDVDLYDREGSRNDGPNGLLRVGYVGRLEARKGVHLLVEAMVQVPEATLEIIGEGPARDAIDEQIRSSGLTTRVSLSGHVEAAALPDRYANFDVLVVPSLETSSWIEQFGRVAIEGMAAGLVVIASASGSLPEVIGDAGVLVRPGDVGALAAALNRLGSDPEERARLGKLARKRSERFSWSSIAREQLEMYREMLVRGP